MKAGNSRHYWLAGLAAVFVAASQSAWAAPSMDLSSTSASNPVTATTLHNAPAAVIMVAGHQQVVHVGDALTNAQIVALQQVMSTGHQNLQIGTSGSAAGGSVNLGLFGSNFSSLNVPMNVQAFGSAAHTLSIGAGLTASGSLIALTDGTKFAISAGNVLVNPGGQITSINTSGKAIDLLISSATNIVNLGTISSSRNLVLTAADGTIKNAGTIYATNTVTFNTGITKDLVVNNAGGSITSADGSVNFRDSAYGGKGVTAVVGGSISAANAVNFNGGNGDVEGLLENVSGLVNVYGGVSHVLSNSDLSVGTIQLSGDPSFVASAGSLTLHADQIFHGQNLALIAQRDIVADPKVKLIDLSSATANGGLLTMVAGFNMNVANATLDPVTGKITGGHVDLTSGTIAGGSVILPNVTIKTGTGLANGFGGKVAIYTNGGLIVGGNTTLAGIDTSAPSGTAGTVLIESPRNITIGTKPSGVAIKATGATGGDVGIFTEQPFWSTAPQFDKDGNMANDFDMPGGSLQGSTTIIGSINTTATKNNGGPVQILQSSAVSTGAISTVSTGLNKFGGQISLGATGPITVNGSLSSYDSKGSAAFISLAAGGALVVNGDLDAHGFVQGGQVSTTAFAATTISGAVNTFATAPNGFGQPVNMAAGGIGGAVEVAKGINSSGPGKGGTVSVDSFFSNVNIGFNPLSVSPLPITSKAAPITTFSKNGQAGDITLNAGDNVWVSGPISATSGVAATFQKTVITGNDRVRIDGTVDTSTSPNGGKSGTVTMTANLLGGSSPFFGIETGAIKTDGSQGDIALTANKGVVLVHGGLSAQGLKGNSKAGAVIIQTGAGVTVQGSINQTSLGSGAISVLSAGLNNSTGRVLISGDIKGSSANGVGTLLAISGQDGVTVGGGISTHGIAGANSVALFSQNGIVNVGKGIDATGTNSSTGTHGSTVSISGAGVYVGGDINVSGGNGAAGNGGAAGDVSLSGIQSPVNGLYDGYITVKGSVSARGGNSTTANGQGPGGNITFNGGSLLVTGKDKFGNSIDASGGQNSTAAYGTVGSINLKSDATQDIPGSFDFTSTTKGEYALPGSILNIGNAKVAGTAGGIKANTTTMNATTLSASDTFNGPITILIRSSSAPINEGGQSKQIYAFSGNTINSPRTMVTPGEAMALYAKTHSLPAVTVAANGTLSGSTVEVNSFDFSHPISAFKLPVSVVLQIDTAASHPTAFIDASKASSMAVAGSIIAFSTDNVASARQITIANSSFKFAQTGQYFDTTGSLGGTGISLIGGKTLKIEDNGFIAAPRIYAQATGGGITLTMGDGASMLNSDPTVGQLQLYSGNGGTHYAGNINVQNVSKQTTSNINALAISLFGGNVVFGQKGAGNSDYFGPIVTPNFASPNYGRFQTAEVAGKLSLAVPANLTTGPNGFLVSGGDMLLASPSTSTTSTQLIAGGNLTVAGGVAEFDAGTFAAAGKDLNVSMLSGISQGAAATFSSKGNMTFSSLQVPVDLEFGNTYIVGKDLHFASNVQGFGSAGVLVGGTGFVGGSVTVGSYAPLKYSNQSSVFFDGNWSVGKDVSVDGWSASGNGVELSGTYNIGGKLTMNSVSTGVNNELIIGKNSDTIIRTGGDVSLTNLNGQIEVGKGAFKAFINSNKNISLLGTGPSGNVTFSAGSGMSAGTFGARPGVGVVLTPANVATAGSITIDGGGMVTIGAQSVLSTVGGDLKIVARGGDANPGQGGFYRASGGNLSILASGQILGGAFDNSFNFGNNFSATGLVNGNKLTGGGVEIQSGTTTSQIAALVANRTTPFNFQNGGNDVMSPVVTQAKGQIVLTNGVTANNTGNLAHAVNLLNTNTVVNPVVLIKANNAQSVILDSIVVNSITGVSETRSGNCDDYVVDTDEDDDSAELRAAR